MSQANTASDALFTSLMTSVLDMWQAYKFHDASAFLKKHANPDIASKSIFGYVWTDIRNLMTLLMSNEERYHRLKHSDSYLTSKKTLWTVYAGLSTEFARVIRLFDSLTIDPNLVSGHGVQSSASKWMGALEEIVQIIHARRDMVQIFRGVQSLSSLQYELHDDSLNRLLSSLHSLPSLLRTFSTFTQIAEIKKDTLMEAKALQCCLEAYACLGSLEFLRTMALLHQAKHSLKLLSRDGDGDKGMTAHETYRWLKLLHTHLVSKATILFFRILQKQEKIVGVDILTQRPSIDPDFFAWVFELCSKHECSYVGIVFECGGRNIGDLGWTCPIPVGECSPQTVAGLQAWPVLFEFPQDYKELKIHWPNVISLVTDKHNAISLQSRSITHAEPSLFAMYVLQKVNQNLYFVAIFGNRKRTLDKPTTIQLNRLTAFLSDKTVWDALKITS